MSRYVLVGSTTPTALSFIRYAALSNLKILCLPYPYHHDLSPQDGFLISSLGGVPVSEFRSKPHITDHLKSILNGTRGVIWAGHPIRSTHDQWFRDYSNDLRTLFDAMREETSPRRFLYLREYTRSWTQTSQTKPVRILYGPAEEEISKSLEDVMTENGLEWTIVQGRQVLKRNRGLEASDEGIMVTKEPTGFAFSEDIARTMVEVLKVNGFSSKTLCIKNVKLTERTKVENVIGRLSTGPISKTQGIYLNSILINVSCLVSQSSFFNGSNSLDCKSNKLSDALPTYTSTQYGK